MIYKVTYSEEALDDFRRIGAAVFEASKSREITLKYQKDLFEAIEKKQLFPLSGTPLFFDDFFTGFYFVHFKAYNAFYTVVEDVVEVVRILPSKSDYMKVLFGENYEQTSIQDKPDYLNETPNE